MLEFSVFSEKKNNGHLTAGALILQLQKNPKTQMQSEIPEIKIIEIETYFEMKQMFFVCQ